MNIKKKGFLLKFLNFNEVELTGKKIDFKKILFSN